MREKGLSKTEIAEKIGRSEHFVKRWWREHPALIERPAGANDVVLKKASLSSFRDLDIRRGFLEDAIGARGGQPRMSSGQSTSMSGGRANMGHTLGARIPAMHSEHFGRTLGARARVMQWKGGWRRRNLQGLLERRT